MLAMGKRTVGWNVLQLKVENHAQFVAVSSHGLDELCLVVDAWHLTNAKSVIFLEDGTEILEVLVQSWSAGIVLGTLEDGLVGVGERLVLANKVDDVDAEAVCAAIKPEAHRLVSSLAHSRIFPVEVGLLSSKEAEIVLIGSLVIFPCTPLEVALPVVGRLAVSLGVIARSTPDVPIAVRVIFGLARFFEPFVLVAGVVHDEVEDELHAALVQLVTQDVDVGNVAIWRVNDFVVTDIITLGIP